MTKPITKAERIDISKAQAGAASDATISALTSTKTAVNEG